MDRGVAAVELHVRVAESEAAELPEWGVGRNDVDALARALERNTAVAFVEAGADAGDTAALATPTAPALSTAASPAITL